MSTAAIIGGTVAGGVIGAVGSSKAASSQANAANQAAQLQYQESQNALQFQQQQYNTTQQQLAPWLRTGTNAINELNQLMGMGGPGFGGQGQPGQGGPGQMQRPWMGTGGFTGLGGGADGQFGPMPIQGNGMMGNTDLMRGGMLPINGNAPQQNAMFRNPDEGNFGTPGATTPAGGPGGPQSGGTVPTGGTPLSSLSGSGQLTPFTNWNQQFQAPTNVTEQNDPGYQFRLQQGQQALENSAAAKGGLLSGGTAKAEQQFGQDYASNEYGNVYNRALGEYQQNYNIFQNNQNTQFNRLASLAGLGQTTAAQLGSFGQQSANNAGNIFMQTGQMQGQDLQNAAAARASGYTGMANSLSGIGSNLGQMYLLNKLLG